MSNISPLLNIGHLSVQYLLYYIVSNIYLVSNISPDLIPLGPSLGNSWIRHCIGIRYGLLPHSCTSIFVLNFLESLSRNDGVVEGVIRHLVLMPCTVAYLKQAKLSFDPKE